MLSRGASRGRQGRRGREDAVILSVAKNPSALKEILRCAQDDTCLRKTAFPSICREPHGCAVDQQLFIGSTLSSVHPSLFLRVSVVSCCRTPECRLFATSHRTTRSLELPYALMPPLRP